MICACDTQLRLCFVSKAKCPDGYDRWREEGWATPWQRFSADQRRTKAGPNWSGQRGMPAALAIQNVYDAARRGVEDALHKSSGRQ